MSIVNNRLNLRRLGVDQIRMEDRIKRLEEDAKDTRIRFASVYAERNDMHYILGGDWCKLSDVLRQAENVRKLELKNTDPYDGSLGMLLSNKRYASLEEGREIIRKALAPKPELTLPNDTNDEVVQEIDIPIVHPRKYTRRAKKVVDQKDDQTLQIISTLRI